MFSGTHGLIKIIVWVKHSYWIKILLLFGNVMYS